MAIFALAIFALAEVRPRALVRRGARRQEAKRSALGKRRALHYCYSGLMSCGSSRTELNRHFGVYIGRVLNGEKLADLPVQQATKLQLVIDPKAAKTIGLTVQPSLLARAAELIEYRWVATRN